MRKTRFLVGLDLHRLQCWQLKSDPMAPERCAHMAKNVNTHRSGGRISVASTVECCDRVRTVHYDSRETLLPLSGVRKDYKINYNDYVSRSRLALETERLCEFVSLVMI